VQGTIEAALARAGITDGSVGPYNGRNVRVSASEYGGTQDAYQVLYGAAAPERPGVPGPGAGGGGAAPGGGLPRAGTSPRAPPPPRPPPPPQARPVRAPASNATPEPPPPRARPRRGGAAPPAAPGGVRLLGGRGREGMGPHTLP